MSYENPRRRETVHRCLSAVKKVVLPESPVRTFPRSAQVVSENGELLLGDNRSVSFATATKRGDISHSCRCGTEARCGWVGAALGDLSGLFQPW